MCDRVVKNLIKSKVNYFVVSKFILLVLVWMFCLPVFSANGKFNSVGKTVSNEVKAVLLPLPKVTFIELGSVNCIPCKMMRPVMKKVEDNFSGQVKVIFYDVRTEEGAPYGKDYHIRVIPTQVFLDSKGQEYARHEGFYPYEELVKVLEIKGLK